MVWLRETTAHKAMRAAARCNFDQNNNEISIRNCMRTCKYEKKEKEKKEEKSYFNVILSYIYIIDI